MSSIASPAKAKAFLATIKEIIVDNEKDVSLETLYVSFLCLEIFQRGVVVNETPPFDDTNKILETVQSVAGKPLLMPDSSASASLPKPLMAGSLGMQGKIAEAIVTRLDQREGTTTPMSSSSSSSSSMTRELQQAFSKQVVAPIVQRCQDVQDNRFLVLMKLWHDEDTATVNLLTLAEGSYYRAASFQPDAPPTWKKAWETHRVLQGRKQRVETTWHWESYGSIPALEALCRIMKGKGNLKRASELSVRLASAWLDATTMILNKTTGSQSPSSLTIKIEESFVEPFRPLPSKLSANKTVSNARRLLSDVSLKENISPEDLMLFDVLYLELLHMEHKVGLVTIVEELEQQSMNRSSTLNASQIQEQAKDVYFLSKADDENSEDNFQAATAMIERCSSQEESTSIKSAAFAALSEFMGDQREIIWALQRSSRKSKSVDAQKMWIRMGDFVVSAIAKRPFQDAHSILEVASETERVFWGEVAHLVCQVSWMTFASHVEKEKVLPFSSNDFEFCHLLSDALTQEKREEAIHVKTAAVSSKSQAEEVQYMHLRVTHLATKCWMLLHRDSLQSDDVLKITNEMLSFVSSNQDLIQMDADRGVTFLGSMLSWSGFFRTPWEFCIVPEARIMIQKARLVLNQSQSMYKRRAHAVENLLLDLAEADVEISALKDKALQLYRKTADSPDMKEDSVLSVLVRAKCHLGISRLEPKKDKNSDNETTIRAKESLSALQSLTGSSSPLCIWKFPGIQYAAIRFQIVLSRQFIANDLVEVGRLQEAGEFLQDAVKDAPSDQIASFALGSFLLRMVFFHGHSSPEAQKLVQTQLLKSAKLDSSKAGPFALLGYWYESRNDTKRSVGCYAKALILDPSHPVAGRGMIRLADDSARIEVVDRAIASASSLNGWAWLFIGIRKAKFEGNDELAVCALLKATRARDIEDPYSDPLAVFYSGSARSDGPDRSELVKALIELSACYRRLGRCSAELRTLHSALEVSGEQRPWSLLHACAQAEMEMGLIEDAKERFEEAAMCTSGSRSLTSQFGNGVAAFMMGRRDLQDGKAGVALKHIMDAIASCSALARDSCSLSKLVGDMHTFLAAFPPELFSEEIDPAASKDCFQNQMRLVARGTDFYTSALEITIRSMDKDEAAELKGHLICDEAVNILLQAQLTARWRGLSNNECSMDSKIMEAFHLARDRFSEALQDDPLWASAWCGLGCSLVDDPIKAQHAFSRAIGLDSASPDPYANLGWLYLENQEFGKGAEMCDVLTQVADTPMTWISRAYQLEKKTLNSEEKEPSEIEQISDAYRAALQIQKDPFALLGLAASFRVAAVASSSREPVQWENHNLLEEYQSITSATPSDEFSIPSNNVKANQNPMTASSSTIKTKQAIIEEPDRGDAWLNLSRDILLGVSGEIDEGTSSAAKAAACRASALLLGRLTDASTHVGAKVAVHASDLSASLALESWLDSKARDDHKKKAQLALIICPQNDIARELLRDN